MREIEVTRRFQQRAQKDSRTLSFVGAGAYRHYIPAPVSIRGDCLAIAAEQEKLSTSRELADSLSRLNAMDASYCAGGDLISALVQAIGIVQKTPRRRPTGRILIASTVNPFYRKAIITWLKQRGIDPTIVPYNEDEGAVGPDQLIDYDKKSADIIIVQYPNFFGVIEAIDDISDWAYKQGISLFAIVNPLSLGAQTPPGRWGRHGADIAIYDLQTLGLPVFSAGSAPGFISLKRRMNNRLKTAVKPLAETFETRPSNSWMLARAEAYLNYLGANGLARIARQCAQNLASLESRLLEIPLLSSQFSGVRFHECVIKFNRVDLPTVLSICERHGFQIGYPLAAEYPELGECILVNATEVHLPEDIDAVLARLSEVVEAQPGAAYPYASKS